MPAHPLAEEGHDVKEIINPHSWFKRFLMNFSLAYSACLVVMLITWIIGRWDTFIALAGSLAFSVLFGVVRGSISVPGTRLMSSPVRDN